MLKLNIDEEIIKKRFYAPGTLALVRPSVYHTTVITETHMERLSKDQYYINIAHEVANRATCLKARIGAIIVRDDQIISTGYNGAPRGTKSDQEHGYSLRELLNVPSGQRYELDRNVHAEQNAIINAARAGVSLLGGDLYIYGEKVTGEVIDAYPCFFCKRMMMNCGFKRVICNTTHGIDAFEMEKWTQDWAEHDIINDAKQYGAGLSDDELGVINAHLDKQN